MVSRPGCSTANPTPSMASAKERELGSQSEVTMNKGEKCSLQSAVLAIQTRPCRATEPEVKAPVKSQIIVAKMREGALHGNSGAGPKQDDERRGPRAVRGLRVQIPPLRAQQTVEKSGEGCQPLFVRYKWVVIPTCTRVLRRPRHEAVSFVQIHWF